jgi:hypothetical protein
MHAQKLVGGALAGLNQTLQFVLREKHGEQNVTKAGREGDKSIQINPRPRDADLIKE